MDADRFRVLMSRHADKIHNFAWRLAGNDADAADLAQEAFVRAFDHRDQYDLSRPFDAWVGRILHNLFIDHTRRYEKKNVVSYDAPILEGTRGLMDTFAESDPDPLAHALEREDDVLLQKALSHLPPDTRSALTLCDVEGRSYEEIADIMDCPIGTVRSRLHHGRRMFRRAFESLRTGALP
jgi:RNA polymerase sigma-70 factor (ECF subfamily)